MSSIPHNTIPSRTLVAHLLLLSATVAPHIQHLNHWLVGFYFALALMRLAIANRIERLPGRFLLLLLSIGALAIVVLHQTTPFGKETAIGLLVVVLGLKLMELRYRRDVYITVLIGFFIIITQFLYNQSMLLASVMLCVTLGLTMILVEINYLQPTKNPWLAIRKMLILFGQALPIMMVLFILFPRLSGPLWNLGLDNKSAVTGFSDTISPGSISHLSQSRAVAFRVDFAGPIPPPEKRYWRGLVLWETDGYNWTTGKQIYSQAETYRAKGNPIPYEITLEPNQQKWLFSLDLPAGSVPNTHQLPDFQIQAKKPITQRLQYKLLSYTDYTSSGLDNTKRQKGLNLPGNITPRMHKLVSQWQDSSSSDRDIINAALRHFNREEFIYTLSPPALGSNPADTFLFDTRRGFCEHYATSFTLLMRIAGIPARVVAGYQGGEINPHGGYLIVRQSNAHAWSEVWLGDQGWVRIDPTAAVAPERIEHSINLDNLTEGAPVQFQIIDPGPLKALIRQLGFGVDFVNASWHRWVLGYTNKRQNEMLSLFGLDFLKGTTLGIAMVAVAALIVLVITIGILRSSQLRRDPVLKSYQRFCKKLAKQKLARFSNEGPNDYAQRIIKQRPDLADSVTKITRLYIGLRYGQVTSPETRKLFTRLVHQFSP